MSPQRPSEREPFFGKVKVEPYFFLLSIFLLREFVSFLLFHMFHLSSWG